MSRRRNQAQSLDAPSPDSLEPHQALCLVGQCPGSSLFEVTDVGGHMMLVELPSKFRKSVWVKRGSYVVVDTSKQSSATKIAGVIEYVVQSDQVKDWKRLGLWPAGFVDSRGDERVVEEEEDNITSEPQSAAAGGLAALEDDEAEGHETSEPEATLHTDEDLWHNPNRR